MLFSIITVTFNNLHGLKQTYSSLHMQSCDDYEWIVIDGGSDDGSAGFLHEISPSPRWGEGRGEGEEKPERHSNIDLRASHPPHPTLSPQGRGLFWLSEKDEGIYDAMNKGIERANGDYLLFLNAGDTLAAPDALAKVKDAAGPDFIYGDALEGENRKPARSHRTIARGLFTHHQAMFYRRETLGDLRYDLTYKIAADYDFTARFLQKTDKALYLPFPVCIFEPGGISQQRVRQGREEQYQIREKMKLCHPVQNCAITLLQQAASGFRSLCPALYWRLKSSSNRKTGSPQN